MHCKHSTFNIPINNEFTLNVCSVEAYLRCSGTTFLTTKILNEEYVNIQKHIHVNTF